MVRRASVYPAALRLERRRKIGKAAAGIGGAVALMLAASSAAQAQCAHSGALGLSPAGTRLFAFGASAASVISSSITAMNTGFQTQTSAFVASPPGTQPDQFAGGAWIRGIGGFLNIDSKSNGTFVDNFLPGLSGQASCQSFARSDFFGVQGGIDLGRLDLGASGWNIHGGVTAGYFESNSSVTGGVSATSQVPFVGIYAALTGGGGFFMDAQARWDFYDINVADPSVQVPGASTKARGFGFTSSAGYNWAVGNFFVEPSIGIVYSRTSVDALVATAAVPLPVVPTPVGTAVSFSDVESVLGRAGVRVGTSFVTGGVALQPFVTASVWHEFAGDSPFAVALTTPAGEVLTANLNSSRIGTFGQFSLGFAASVLNTGWLGYARVDYRKGDDIEGLSVNGGLRYQFAPAPQPAVAALAQAPVVSAAPTWTGFYIGGFAGGAWSGKSTTTEIATAPLQYNGLGTNTSYDLGSSVIAGMTIGYNHQMGSVVAGLEAEGGYLRVSGSAPFAVSPDTIASTEIGDWYAVLAGRLGFAFGPALIYGKAGGALVTSNSSVIDTCTAAGCGAATVSAVRDESLRLTWTAGGGLEFALNENWSIKGEYLYIATDQSYVVSGPGFSPAGGLQNFQWSQDIPGIHTAKIGINYRFPISAPAVVQTRG